MALAAGIYVSLRHKIQPILTLLILLAGSVVYLVVTNVAGIGIRQYGSNVGIPGPAIVVAGIIGVLITFKILKGMFRVPSFLIHHLLSISFLLFLFYQINAYFDNSQYFTKLMYLSISEGGIPLNIYTLQHTASFFPELLTTDSFFLSILSAVMAIFLYLYFAGRFRHPGNSMSFAFVLFMILFFISLFNVNPSALPVLSERMMGLNVIQWGLLLICILYLAHIIAIEMGPSRRKREILKKAPAPYSLLIFYLLITLISFQASSVYRQFDIKVLIIGYFITSGVMVIYFLKRVESNYLRYGTVSIILLIFILFLQAQIAEYRNMQLYDPNTINTPGTILKQPISRDGGEKILDSYQFTAADLTEFDRVPDSQP